MIIMMCGGLMNGMGMWGPGWMLATGAPLLVLVAAGVALALSVRGGGLRSPQRATTTAGSSSATESPAVAVVKQRYARGEIDHAEFERLIANVLRVEDG